MSDTPVTLAMNVVDRMSGPLGNISKAIDEVGTRGTAANKGVGLLDSALSGIGAGVALGGMFALQGAIGQVTSVMGGAVQGAMRQEASMGRLNIVLRDSIPNWNGSTAAIEAATHARVGLGFSEDELTTTAGSLVARTHDVAKALDLQKAAMDIARFRGVDLATATLAVGKAYDGSATALQRMGIAIKAGSTGEEALRQAIAATAGQAEAFAGTSLGKMQIASDRIDETMNRLGTAALPVVADAANNLTNVIEALTGAMQTTGTSTQSTGLQVSAFSGFLSQMTGGLSTAFASIMDFSNAQHAAAAAAEEAKNNGILFAESIDADRVAAGQADLVVRAAAEGEKLYAATLAIAAHGARDDAYETRLLTAAIQAKAAAEAFAIPPLVTANGMTISNKLSTDGYAAALSGATAKQTAYLDGLKATTTASGGASAATKALAVAIKDSLATAYDALKIKATAALDAIHAKNLQQIEDTGKMWDKQLDDKSAAFQAPVDAAQKALDDKKKAEEKASLQSAIDTATDNASRQAAQTAMDDWMEQERINQMQADANVQKTMIANAKTFDDQLTANKKKAEDDRYAKQKKDLDAALALLKSSLSSQSVAWAAHLNSVLKIIGDKDPDFVAKGKATGKAYGDAVAAAIKASQSVIAAAVASVAPAGGGGSVPGRASGGPVMGGSSYIVGERGPELFVPGQSGSVIPNGGGGRGGGGGNVNLSVTISGAAVFDPMGVAAQQVAAALLPGIRRELGRQGVTF